jgi:hypothetical protein
MLQKPTQDQQNRFKEDFISLVENYDRKEELKRFEESWDKTVHFISVDDTIKIETIGCEKLPLKLAEQYVMMVNKFDNFRY